MGMSSMRATWTGAGFLLALTVGSPAVADDVELLLTVPGASNAAKPNVLFILDSSGSMTTEEFSQEPFDGAATYTGDCDPTAYYWTTRGPRSCRIRSPESAVWHRLSKWSLFNDPSSSLRD